MIIPERLRAAMSECLEGISRLSLIERAERMSSLYREKAGSSIAVRDEMDALAYAITRSPATFGAVHHVLTRLQERSAAFAPTSMLDLGTGAGAASWAATEIWPELQFLTQVDCNLPLLTLNKRLAQQSRSEALRNASHVTTDLTRSLESEAGDLVVLSYMLAELKESQVLQVLETAWEHCLKALVLVEPGTPAGYQRILMARRFLESKGGRLLAPCSHELPCPLVPPDWCHFAQRVERSRDHKILKSAEVPYEDEKFSYLIAVREAIFSPVQESRILTRPARQKVSAKVKLCKPDGTADLVSISIRDKEAFKRAKKKEWGDLLLL